MVPPDISPTSALDVILPDADEAYPLFAPVALGVLFRSNQTD